MVTKMIKRSWLVGLSLTWLIILITVGIVGIIPRSTQVRIIRELPEAHFLGAVDRVYEMPLAGVGKNDHTLYGENKFSGPRVLEIAAIDKPDGILSVDFGYWEEIDCNIRSPGINFVPDDSWFKIVPRSEHAGLFQYVILKELGIQQTLVGCPVEAYAWRSYGIAKIPFVRGTPVRIIIPYGIGARYQILP